MSTPFSLPKLPRDKMPKSSAGKGSVSSNRSKTRFQDFDVNNLSPPKPVDELKRGNIPKAPSQRGVSPSGLSRNVIAMEVNSQVPSLNLPSG